MQTEIVVPALKPEARAPKWAVVFGANTGGPQALLQVLPQFPPDFPGSILVVQHMRPGFTRVLVDLLSQVCRLPVCEPEDGQALRPGRILVAPSDSRLTIEDEGSPSAPDYSVLLEDVVISPETAITRVDDAMSSVGRAFALCSIGVLLTGVGTDGKEGMRTLREAGGITIAQDEASSVVHSLPASAVDAGVVQEVLPLWSIPDRVMAIVGGDTDAVAA